MAGRSFPNGQLLPMRNGFITSLFIPWYGGSCLRTSKFEWLSRTDCTIWRRWYNDGRTLKSEVRKHYWVRSVVFLKGALSRHFRGTPVGLKMLQNQRKYELTIFFLKKILLVYWILFLSSTARDGQDWKGLKLKKTGQLFQVWRVVL